MKRWSGGVLIAILFMLLILRYVLMKNPIGENYLMNALSNGSNPLEWVQSTLPPAYKNTENSTQVISTDTIIFSLFAQRNISKEEQESLLFKLSFVLPRLSSSIEAIRLFHAFPASLIASMPLGKS